jgi:molybdopterin converting factor small subunit
LSIVVNYFGLLASKFQTTSDSVAFSSGTRIRDLFTHLISKHDQVFKSYIYDPEKGEMNGEVVVSVNDVPILQMQGLDTIIGDGDQIDILPIFAGGG